MQLSGPWRAMLDTPFFKQADCNGCRALEKMLAVFVERSHSLFKVGSTSACYVPACRSCKRLSKYVCLPADLH